LLEAYAEGVNAGAAALAARPFEYLLLGQSPTAWRAEDSLLVVYAMWVDLQGLDDADEQQRGRLAAALPAAALRLLVEPDPAWEAPLDGSRLPEVPLPSAEEYDLRALDRALFESLDAPAAGDSAKVGSNNWAVAGSRVQGGGALVANDMHLGLRVPNIWYRARFVAAADGVDVTGVSLPGVPAIVAGSNGRVAW
jgi:penicillin amidase